ncbi:MAG: glycosyltransferase family A protein [Chloroflexota bacterium]|nr:glycosyltransferase family A protein [Chloroflexota bacterium]
MPTVSVIIPTHNRGWLIPKTISYVLDQTYADLEIIVIDNGSTDNTRSVVESLLDDRITYIYQNNSGSPAKPRNTGITASKGRYVSFLDDDDVWYPTKLEHVVNAFESTPSPDIVCHNQYENNHGRLSKLLRYKSNRENTFDHLLFHGNCLSGSATTVKRQALIEAKGYREEPEFFEIEDYDLWIRLALLGKQFHFLSAPLGELVIHESNGTMAGLHRRFPNHRRMLRNHLRNTNNVRTIDQIRFRIVIMRTFYSQIKLHLEKWKRRILLRTPL